MKREILLVCSGNTCRSPMAEILLKKRINDAEIGVDYAVSSAGLYVLNGDSANGKSIQAMHRYGLDLSNHCSVALNSGIVQKAFLILTMTGRQKAELIRTFPGASGKTYTLPEYADGSRTEIIDPYGFDQHVYDQTAEMIEHYIELLILRLKAEINF